MKLVLPLPHLLYTVQSSKLPLPLPHLLNKVKVQNYRCHILSAVYCQIGPLFRAAAVPVPKSLQKNKHRKKQIPQMLQILFCNEVYFGREIFENALLDPYRATRVSLLSRTFYKPQPLGSLIARVTQFQKFPAQNKPHFT